MSAGSSGASRRRRGNARSRPFPATRGMARGGNCWLIEPRRASRTTAELHSRVASACSDAWSRRMTKTCPVESGCPVRVEMDPAACSSWSCRSWAYPVACSLSRTTSTANRRVRQYSKAWTTSLIGRCRRRHGCAPAAGHEMPNDHRWTGASGPGHRPGPQLGLRVAIRPARFWRRPRPRRRCRGGAATWVCVRPASTAARWHPRCGGDPPGRAGSRGQPPPRSTSTAPPVRRAAVPPADSRRSGRVYQWYRMAAQGSWAGFSTSRPAQELAPVGLHVGGRQILTRGRR